MSKTIRGFTLIELLVVIAIIGVLASVVLASLNSARAKSRDAARIAQLKQMALSLELYYDSNGSYPTSGGWTYSTAWNTGLVTSLAPFLPSMPRDPLNTGNGPWGGGAGNYSYAYLYYTNGYELVGLLETPNHPAACVNNDYKRNNGTSWCTAFGGSYSNQLYAITVSN